MNLFIRKLKCIPTISTAFAHIYVTDTNWIKVMCGEKMQETIEFKNRGFLTLEFKEKAVSEMELLYKELQKSLIAFFPSRRISISL